MGEGIKHDSDKLRWDLLPFKEMEDVIAVLTHGAKEYGDYNWQELPKFKKRFFSAMLRHTSKYKRGIKKDEETGRSHLAHVICCALFLMWKENKKSKKKSKKKKHA